MKKVFSAILIMAIILCCCACSSATQETTAPTEAPETPIPEPTATPEPETVPGKVRTLSLLVPYKVLSRGDKVNVLDEDEDYYYVELDGVEGFISKGLVRMFYEQIPEERTAYAKSGTALYDNVNLTGTPVDSPTLNTEITVVDELNGIAIVRYGDFEGYISSDLLSDTEMSTWTDYTYDVGGSGGGGGAAPAPAPAPVDGGDIALAFHGLPDVDFSKMLVPLFLATEMEEETETEFKAGEGTIFADGTVMYLCELKYGDEVRIHAQSDDTTTLFIQDLLLDVPADSVKADSDKGYESWEGFAKSGSKLYSDSELTKEVKTLNINDKITVLEDFEEYYLVQLGDEYFYMKSDNVSEEEISTWSAYTYDAGGWSGGGDAGGGAAAGGGEWTDPVM